MRYDKIRVINTGSMAGAITSSILDLRNVIELSLIFSVTSAASPTGTVAIQFANDCTELPNGNLSGGTWGTDASAQAAPAVTANGVSAWRMVDVGHLFARVVYTSGTGSGTLDVYGATKGA